ncbi:methionine/alanine import family NSS transporter small subunit [Microbacterium lacus]|uniref:methionine/alanine import family NSS transporter small subunit n=1 Tax=Microbacterium lacus TaxID=415217 RepID=UPI003850F5DB
MTPIAVTFLVLSIVIVWGGAVASALSLRRRSEVGEYPPGADDDHRQADAPIEHDT